MKLVLPLAAPWIESSTPDGATWTHPETQIRVEVAPLIPLPDDRKAWAERVCYAPVPTGGSLQQVSIADTKLEKGWLSTVVSLVYRNSEKERTDFRVVFFMEVGKYGGVVSIVVPYTEIEPWEATWRPALVATIQQIDTDQTVN
jgi:hypothetical protein